MEANPAAFDDIFLVIHALMALSVFTTALSTVVPTNVLGEVASGPRTTFAVPGIMSGSEVPGPHSSSDDQ